MADGSIVIKTELDNKQLEKELVDLSKKIERLENQIYTKKQQQLPLVKQAEELEISLERARQKLASMEAGTISADASGIKEQQAIVRELQSEYNAVQRKVMGYDEAIEKATIELGIQKEKAGELVQELDKAAGKTDKMAAAQERAAKSAKKFSSRLKSLVSSALVFTVITRALSSFRDWLGKVIKTNDEATAAMARLKAALLTLAQPIVNIIIPAFTIFVNLLTKVVTIIADLVSKLFGTTIKDSANAAENLYNEANALESVGDAAEDAAGSLAGFDEINTINTEAGTSGGATSGESLPDFSEIGDTGWLSDVLGKAAGWVTAALLLGGIALIAIGACTGNLAAVLAGLLLLGAAVVVGTETGVLQSWVDVLGLNSVAEFVVLAILLGGIAIVAIGAAMGNILMVIAGLALIGVTILYTKQSGMMKSWTEQQLSKAASYVTAALLLGGIALIAIGAATSNVLMIISGMALLGAGIYVGVESGTLKSWADTLGLDSVFDYVIAAIQLAGIALIAIGAAMTNIFMILAGATILAAGIAAEIIGEQTIKEWWEKLRLTTVEQWIGVVTLLAGICLIAIGAAMTNILMIIAGMALIGIGSGISAANGNLENWVTVLGLERVTGWVTAAILLAGMGLVVFGIVMVNILMVIAGLGLLYAGFSVGTESGTFKNWWDALGLQKVSSWLSTAMKLGGIALIALGAGTMNLALVIAGLGLLGVGVVSSAARVRKGSFGSSSSGSFGGVSVASMPSTTAYTLPRLATGAVIPPNREFMAVLGDQRSGNNIEAPESLIRKIVREEAGGNNTELLQAILEAVREGSVMVVDRDVLARAAVKGINSMTQRAGKPVLLI